MVLPVTQFPEMTTTERVAATPANNTVIFDTTLNQWFIYQGGAYVAVNAAGANIALSNLNPTTAINATLRPGGSNSIDIGTFGNFWRNVWVQSSINLYTNGNSGTGATLSIQPATGIPSNLSLPNINIGTGTNNSLGGLPFTFTTQTEAGADANATASMYFNTGNKTAGTGNSGDFFFICGTSSGGLKGRATFGSHLKSIQTTAPTTTTNANAGTGASSGVTNATDTAGNLSLTLGSAANVAGAQTTVNFNGNYAVAPIVSLTPANASAASNSSIYGVYITSTVSGFTVNFATAGVPLDVLNWTYYIIETQ